MADPRAVHVVLLPTLTGRPTLGASSTTYRPHTGSIINKYQPGKPSSSCAFVLLQAAHSAILTLVKWRDDYKTT